MKALKIIGICLLSLVILFGLALGLATLTAFRPPEREILKAFGGPGEAVEPYSLRLLTWNLGYCGIDAETDVFIEGGTLSGGRSEDAVTAALEDISSSLYQQDADVVFLQEVDKKARRSFQVDQVSHLSGLFPGFQSFFAVNYKSPFVPVPLTSPMGQVLSGIMTISRPAVQSAARYQLPGRYAWPVRVFHLSRCALVTVIPSRVENRSWYLINVHLSAFDAGDMRTQQLAFLKEEMLKRAEEGHYVVVGGDWNALFPGVEKEQFGSYTTPEENLNWVFRVPQDWTPQGWQWCYDPETPTARSNDRPYIPGETFQTIIDGFLVSPDLKVEEISAYNLGYRSSDHHPVAITVRPED
ncbi:MAG: endonuclease/exonuclease/phosphatase family protein [Spirochaetales bacterium]|nr:endonuclease/exonuclease/phosphatase family protein [Spirochaetales bacterium]